MKLLRFVIVVIVAALIGPAARASYPMVRSYTRHLHGGGTQTWAIARDGDGIMYFGNKNGLLSFDSRNWGLTGVENQSTVRSLLVDSAARRLYVGASDEFGYFEADSATGTGRYVNLAKMLPPSIKQFKEIWRILRLEGSSSLWFQADNAIFCYDGSRISTLRVNDRITAAAAINGHLYIATAHGGVSELHDTRIEPVCTLPVDRHIRICALLPYNSALMAVTDYDGLYIIENGAARPLHTDIDDFLRANQVFCASRSESGMYAFGTVSRGAVITGFNGGRTSYANIETGLQNNTVLTTYFDPDGNLWLGLDNGIDQVLVNSPYYSLLGNSDSHGAGYMSLRAGDLLYLGTNQGLFATPYPDADSADPPRLTPILRGQVWDITQIGDEVFVCTDAGVCSGRGLDFRPVDDDIPGSWSVRPLSRHPGYALVSSYDSFYLLRRDPGGRWTSLGPVAGYSDIGGHFSEDRDGNIWISHWLKGVYRLRIDPSRVRFTALRFFDTEAGLPTNRNVGVIAIDGVPVVTTEGGFYRLAPDGSRMIPDERLDAILGVAIAPRLHVSPRGDIWCLTGSTATVAARTPDGATRVDTLSFSPVPDCLIPGFDNFNFLSDDRLIISMQEGFFDVGLRRMPHSTRSAGVFFKSIVAQGDSTVTFHPRAMAGPISLPYSLNSLHFDAIAPEYRADKPVLYSFFLESYDADWSPWSESTAKEYTQLHEGDYRMHVRALNPYTRDIDEHVITFSIMPPWYRSTPAKAIYMFLTLMLLFLGYKAVKSVSLRASRRVASRKEQEIDLMRRHAKEESLLKDYEIADLKGRQLEQDIKHKTEELSNITMNVVRKNEILLDISDRLDKLAQGDRSPADISRQISRIKALIRENISHDDDWRTFMHNFDAAYEDFTKNLQSRHPGLTPTELRVCCYLKMGLSSKEIAPLFNISYRSVEMTRYRLRKKLGLTRENSLTDYLQSLS